jgi:rubrerythrin
MPLQDDFAKAVQTAINLEKTGRAYYLHAAEKTENEAGQRLFTMLAQEEAVHLATFAKLMEQSADFAGWRDLLNGGKSALGLALFSQRSLDKSIRASASELEALSLAMEQERKAIDLFEKMAAQTSSKLAAQVFNLVREQEIVHYDLLQAELDHITKTGFWFDSAEFRMDGKM